MKLLILGGTWFLGRHLVEAARGCGWEVTLFNRGRHSVAIQRDIETLRGDRNGDLSALQGKSWDVVIDTSGYTPSQVRVSAELLAGAVEQYVFISSLGVYPRPFTSGVDETSPVYQISEEQARYLHTIKLIDPVAERNTYRKFYGPLKVLCEQVVDSVMPGRAITIRAGAIVGPYDYHNSISHWVYRMTREGAVLAPGRPDRPVQIIDGRDLAEWLMKLIAARRAGTYIATGPDYILTMQRFLQECIVAGGNKAHLVWVSNQFLQQSNVAARTELPMWHPDDDLMSGLASVNCAKAIAAGLTFRPLKQTIQDVLGWIATLRPDQLQFGLDLNRERQLLQKWYGRALV
jgi:2'-hydroxyisoflavone reductase